MVDAELAERGSAGGDCNWRGAVKSKQLMAEQRAEGEKADGAAGWLVENQVKEGRILTVL